MTDASSPISQPSVRQQVFFSGRVQGVGFRYTTRQIAQNFAVTGFVRNLADGRVELVAEGSPQELRRFLAEIQDRMGANIVRMESHDQPVQGEFRSFQIL